ncbi:2',3'-cyclic-nucleotide 2'-phosphodiesterase [Actinobacillus equuli]|nr:2',3'-cyclic-nucleotide 2'-phosphodiesterase [Actinobacillus equuli]
MKYDYFILGNHEFNFGMTALNEIIKDINAKVLTANFYYKKMVNVTLPPPILLKKTV